MWGQVKNMITTTSLKKMVIVGTAVISSLALTTTVALADSEHSHNNQILVSINASGETKLRGTVSATSSSTITVSSWLGTWVVNITNAKLTPQSESWSDVKVGDKVIVSGKASPAGPLSIIATMVHDISSGQGKSDNDDKDDKKEVKKSEAKGTISNFNASAGTFTLETKKIGDLTVTTSSNTQVFLKPHILSPFSSLANGMEVLVKGILNLSAKTMAALSIKVK